MSHSQFHSISSLYLDMHGLIFERLFSVQAITALPAITAKQYYRRPEGLSPCQQHGSSLQPTSQWGPDYILSPVIKLDPPTFSL
jgi:hypothetical protein